MLCTVDGLVIKSQNYGENDRILTLLTSDGKITVIAKGARSMKSKVQNLTQPFVYGNFELNSKNQGMPWLKGGSIEHSFYDLREDIHKLFLATYICDIANELSGEGVDCGEMLRLTLNTIFAIVSDKRPLEQIKAAYELRAAGISGYCPDLLRCEDCVKEGCADSYFDIMNGAIVCSDCLNARGGIVKKNLASLYDDVRERSVLIHINASSLAALRFALYSPLSKMLSFTLSSDEDLKTFSKACEEYLLHHLGHGFDSLDLYYSIL